MSRNVGKRLGIGIFKVITSESHNETEMEDEDNVEDYESLPGKMRVTNGNKSDQVDR